MTFNFGSFIVKAFQLALVADQAYQETQAPGASASTILQPNNFDNLLLELASIATPVASTPVAPPHPNPNAIAGKAISIQP
jgi:hypothetical protein